MVYKDYAPTSKRQMWSAVQRAIEKRDGTLAAVRKEQRVLEPLLRERAQGLL